MVFSQRTALVCIVTILLLVGCSGSGSHLATTPITSGQDVTNSANPTPSNHIIWEMGDVTIDTEAGTATVVPLRTAEFNLNVVKFLQPPAGSTSNIGIALDLPNSNIANAYIELDLTLKHPFPATQYWGFDTRVIVFGGGSTVGKHDTSVVYPSNTELRMVNADGYTRWWNRTEFGPLGKIFGYTDGKLAPSFTPTSWGTVNGYKYFATGVSSTQVPPNPAESTRGSFSSGQVARRMKLQFPKVTSPFKFKYSIDTSYDNPTVKPPTSVSDFPPEANTPEAYQVVVTEDTTASTAFFNPDDSTFGGDLSLTVEVWDWKQGGGTVANEIDGIWLESPTLLNNQGGAVKISDTWTQSAGSSPNSVKFTGVLTNVTPNAVLNQELFVTVTSKTPTTYKPPIDNFLYPSAPLAAYQLFGTTILDHGTPPAKSITVTFPNGGETLVIGDPATITWTWTGAIVDVVIEYSTDGGATYPNSIVASTPCDGSYLWPAVPDTATSTAKVRITEAGASPQAQDESNANFTISATAEQGWNPVPGMINLAVDNPAPNQSTASPDLGVEQSTASTEGGVWMVDQEGGVADGGPKFFDYLLDWSGPGGNAYQSGFNFNFAPMGRHDVTGNTFAIFGCSANEAQMNPPVVNDPLTAIWYISYIRPDETAVAGDLYMVTWGDQGTVDPPVDDPDAEPWFRTVDVSTGMKGQDGDPLTNAGIFLMPYSHLAGAPAVADADSGDLNVGLWAYPYLTTDKIYRLGFPEYTSDLKPAPIYQAFDVSDAGKCRIAADTDTYLTFDSNIPGTATMVNMIDSMANIYCSGFQVDFVGGQFYYIGLANSQKLMTNDDTLYPAGATAVDLEMLPTITVLEGGDWSLDKNWLAVLFDDGAGGFIVRVYRIDWTVADPDPVVTIVDTTDPIPGTPIGLDVDTQTFKIHVLAKVSGAVKATVFQYKP